METSGRRNGEGKLRDRVGKASFRNRWSIMGGESESKSWSRDTNKGSLREPKQRSKKLELKCGPYS